MTPAEAAREVADYYDLLSRLSGYDDTQDKIEYALYAAFARFASRLEEKDGSNV